MIVVLSCYHYTIKQLLSLLIDYHLSCMIVLQTFKFFESYPLFGFLPAVRYRGASGR